MVLNEIIDGCDWPLQSTLQSLIENSKVNRELSTSCSILEQIKRVNCVYQPRQQAAWVCVYMCECVSLWHAVSSTLAGVFMCLSVFVAATVPQTCRMQSQNFTGGELRSEWGLSSKKGTVGHVSTHRSECQHVDGRCSWCDPVTRWSAVCI